MNIAQLHRESYSAIASRYTDLADLLKAIRQRVLDTVLHGKESSPIRLLGPAAVGEMALESLPRDASILDVGCGSGDNLALMHANGFTDLTGIDIASGMIDEARKKVAARWICGDLCEQDVGVHDLVFAQAFVHLFPKETLPGVFQKLLDIAGQRLYFSTTIHDSPREGLEEKGDVVRYRSRYVLSELLAVVRELLKRNPNWCFHYYFLTDPLGKYWINGIFERTDALSIYERDGVLQYHQFAAPEQIAGLMGEVDRFGQQPAPAGTWLRYDTDAGLDRVENILPYATPVLRSSLEDLAPYVSYLMGEDSVLLKDKINFKLPGSGAFVPHQDAAAGWERFANRLITAALSLDASDADNGALYVARGRHKQGLLTHLRTPLSKEQVAGMRWEVARTESGDALFFDAFAPHLSYPNHSSRSRRMAFLTYHARRYGDQRAAFFAEKRERQPPIDERSGEQVLIRDSFGKLVKPDA